MHILCDSAMPNAHEVFDRYGKVTLKAGREIEASDLAKADALMIRSVTKVDADLLKYAAHLKFVGTATAGTDHIDIELLRRRGIAFASAPGSNKYSVGDYILSVLLVLAQRFDLELSGKSIGIIGCGNTGGQVTLKAKALGMKVVRCDPPRLRAGDTSCASSLDEALSCDFISLHVPLIKEGPDKTLHMIDAERLSALSEQQILINASRGSVLDNAALVREFSKRPDLRVWLDVFEGEPQITYRELLPYLLGATPHIAGYSYESKRRAAFMLACSMGKALDLEIPHKLELPHPEIKTVEIGRIETLDLDLISRLVFSVYDVRRDVWRFRNRCTDGKSFDLLRRTYRERRELSELTLTQVPPQFKETLSGLGFTVNNLM